MLYFPCCPVLVFLYRLLYVVSIIEMKEKPIRLFIRAFIIVQLFAMIRIYQTLFWAHLTVNAPFAPMASPIGPKALPCSLDDTCLFSAARIFVLICWVATS